MNFLELTGTEPPAVAGPPATVTEFWESMGLALLLMFVTEIGDKTFICAAAFGAVKDALATVLAVESTMVLMILVSILSGDVVTDIAGAGWVNVSAIICFGLYFLLFVHDAWYFVPPPPEGSEDHLVQYDRAPEDPPPVYESKRKLKFKAWFDVYWKVAVLTFFAEWADRTQFSVNKLAKECDPLGVAVGCLIGQAICTTIGVFAARYLLKDCSRRRVLVMGAVLFIGLALYTYLWNPGRRFVGRK